MASPKRYIQDKFVLLLLSLDAFLAIATSIFILFRLGVSTGTGYITQYRSNLDLKAFTSGSVTGLLSFIGFIYLVLFFHVFLSLRVYQIHRQLAVSVLALGFVLLIFAVFVSNALLALR